MRYSEPGRNQIAGGNDLSSAGILSGIDRRSAWTLLGYGMCKGAASTDGVLKFTGKDVSMYTLNGGMILYALVAAAIVILFLTIPALRRTKYTIVNESMAKTVL